MKPRKPEWTHGTCDKCGCAVPKPTPAQAAWIARGHRQYCAGCLQDRKPHIEMGKRLDARKKRAAKKADGLKKAVA